GPNATFLAVAQVVFNGRSIEEFRPQAGPVLNDTQHIRGLCFSRSKSHISRTATCITVPQKPSAEPSFQISSLDSAANGRWDILDEHRIGESLAILVLIDHQTAARDVNKVRAT